MEPRRRKLPLSSTSFFKVIHRYVQSHIILPIPFWMVCLWVDWSVFFRAYVENIRGVSGHKDDVADHNRWKEPLVPSDWGGSPEGESRWVLVLGYGSLELENIWKYCDNFSEVGCWPPTDCRGHWSRSFILCGWVRAEASLAWYCRGSDQEIVLTIYLEFHPAETHRIHVWYIC